MGLLSRLQAISTGKLFAFLDDSSHPEQVIPQLIKELQIQWAALKNAEAKSFAVVRAMQKKLDATLGRAVRMERGAELALAKGDDQTAREALREQIRIEKTIPALQEQVEQAQQILNATRDQKVRISQQIKSVKERGEEIRRQLPLQTLGPAANVASPLLRQVAQMEPSLTQQELRSEARREVQSHRSLDERLLVLERQSEVTQRLDHLKTDTKKEK